MAKEKGHGEYDVVGMVNVMWGDGRCEGAPSSFCGIERV